MRESVYACNECGMAERARGREALLQEAFIRLKMRKGAFPYDGEMGSLLHTIGDAPPKECAELAFAYAREALIPLADVRVIGAEVLRADGLPDAVEVTLDAYGVREKVRIKLNADAAG